MSSNLDKSHIYKKRPDQSGPMFSSWHQYDTRQLTIHIEPVAKGRPRFTRNGHAYTPAKTADYEGMIRRCWRKAHGDYMTTQCIELQCDFYVPIPKSMTKADKEKATRCDLRPGKRPDIDNYVKAIMDALNETAYWDDKQIVSLRADKWYASEPRVEIRIREVNKE